MSDLYPTPSAAPENNSIDMEAPDVAMADGTSAAMSKAQGCSGMPTILE